MKAVILAGGLGTRISEETTIKPKPMVNIGDRPILWHIMKYYSCFGVKEFIICLGYKGYCIKEFFSNYFIHTSDITFDLKNNTSTIHANNAEEWKVTLIDTGEMTQTGGRLKRVSEYIGDEPFHFTYGDGLSNVNLSELYKAHIDSGSLATLTAVLPQGRFGALEIENDKVIKFKEKPQGDGAWINGGFFVLSPEAISYIENDLTIWEKEPLEKMANAGKLSSYKHAGFWAPMDTMRDKNFLEELWHTDKAPWKVW